MGSKASLIYQLQPGRPEKDELAPGACSGEEGAWEQPCHGCGGHLSPRTLLPCGKMKQGAVGLHCVNHGIL